jgi:TonB-linked SusC/RagA family outer membrane protein
MERLTLLLACFWISMGLAIAQDKPVSGTVVDENDEPVVGASVIGKGTSVGSATDIDGNFSFSVPAGVSVLTVSYIGYTPVDVRASTGMKITLEPDTKVLEEVVVTALGISREKKTLGYATTSISGSDVVKLAKVNPLTALQGKAAGVDVSSSPGPGGTQNVTIRGFNTFTDNQPLYVIDGVPLTNAQNRAGDDLNSQADFGSGINALNPNDIENMTVLKGSAASALYGSRAAHGVIMITTKSGRNTNGKVHLEYDGGMTVTQVGFLAKEQTMFGQGWSGDRALDENGNWGAPFDGKERVWGNVVDNSQMLKPYVYLKDRIRDFYDLGIGYNNALSMTGGTDRTKYHVSISQNHVDGPIPTDNDMYNRYTIATNASHQTNKVTISSSFNFSAEKNKASPSGQDNSIYRSLNEIATDISIVDLKDYNNKFFNADNYFTPYGLNPYYVLNAKESMQNKYKFFGKAQLDYDLLKNLKLTYRFGGDFETSIADTHVDVLSFSPDAPNAGSSNENPGFYDQVRRQRIQVNHDIFAGFNERFGDLSVNAILGANFNEQSYNAISGEITSIDVPGFYNFNNTLSPAVAAQSSWLYRIWGAYVNADFGYGDYLYLTLTARNDQSSSLPLNNNSYFYPGAMLSFIATDFLKQRNIHTGIFDFAKLRLAYGRTGKDAPRYGVYDRFVAGSVTNPGYPSIDILTFPLGGINAYTVSDRAGNVGLKPELTDEFEIGADFALFNHRAGFEFSYYDKFTHGLIELLPMDPSTGYSEKMANLGDIRNRGIEFSLNLTPVKTKDFSWDISYNFTKNNNTVEKLDVEEVFLGGYSGISIVAVEGKPIGQFKATKAQKVVLDGVEHTVVDGNGNPVATPDMELLDKDINEKYRMGFSNTFSWRGLSLSGTLDYRFGGYFYAYSKDYMHWVGSGPETAYNDRSPFLVPNSVVDNLDGTYSENTTPVDPTALHTFYSNGGFDRDDFAIIDRSYLKLRNVSLAYELPRKLCDKIKIHSLRLSLTASNLLLWTPTENQYTDPEVTTFGNNIAAKFGEFATNPPYQSYVFGLNISF